MPSTDSNTTNELIFESVSLAGLGFTLVIATYAAYEGNPLAIPALIAMLFFAYSYHHGLK